MWIDDNKKSKKPKTWTIWLQDFGYIIKDDKKNYIHPTWALYGGFHEIKDYDNMTLSPLNDTFLQDIKDKNSSGECLLWKKTDGNMIKCFDSKCVQEAHISWLWKAKREAFLKVTHEDIKTDKWLLMSFVFKLFIKNLSEIQDEAKREKMNEINTVNGVLFWWTGSHAYLKQHWVWTSIDHQNRLKDYSQTKNNQKKGKNGQIIDDNEMMGWDYWFSWHHFPWLEEKKSWVWDENEKFLWPSWKQYALVSFFAEKNGIISLSNEENKVNEKSFIDRLKSETLEIEFAHILSQKNWNIMDFSFVYVLMLHDIWIKMAEKMINEIWNVNIIKNHIKSINFFPFLGKRINHYQNQLQLKLHHFDNIVGDNNFNIINKNNCLIKSQLTYLKEYDEDAKEHNWNAQEKINILTNKLNKSKLISKVTNVLYKHQKSFELQEKICEFIFSKKPKKTLAEVQKLEWEFKSILEELKFKEINEMMELNLLNEWKSDYYEWRKQVKLIFIKAHNKITQLKQDFNKSLQDNSNHQKIDPTTLKISLYRDILNSKVPLAQLNHLKEIGKNLAYIDLSKEDLYLFNEIESSCKRYIDSIQNEEIEGSMKISSLEAALKLQISTPEILEFMSQVEALIDYNSRANDFLQQEFKMRQFSHPSFKNISLLISEGEKLKASTSLLLELRQKKKENFIDSKSILLEFNKLRDINDLNEFVKKFNDLNKIENLENIIESEADIQLYKESKLILLIYTNIEGKSSKKEIESLQASWEDITRFQDELISKLTDKLSKITDLESKINDSLLSISTLDPLLPTTSSILSSLSALDSELLSLVSFSPFTSQINSFTLLTEWFVSTISLLHPSDKEEISFSNLKTELLITKLLTLDSPPALPIIPTPPYPYTNLITAAMVLQICPLILDFKRSSPLFEYLSLASKIETYEVDRYCKYVLEENGARRCKEILEIARISKELDEVLEGKKIEGIREKVEKVKFCEHIVRKMKMVEEVRSKIDEIEKLEKEGDGKKEWIRTIERLRLLWKEINEIEGEGLENIKEYSREKEEKLKIEMGFALVLGFKQYTAKKYEYKKNRSLKRKIERHFREWEEDKQKNIDNNDKLKQINWYLTVEEFVYESPVISKNRIFEISEQEPLLNLLEFNHRSTEIINIFNSLVSDESNNKVDSLANWTNLDIKFNKNYKKINMDETLTDEKMKFILSELKTKQLSELEERLTYSQIKKIVESNSDPRNSDPVIKKVKETSKRADEIKKKTVEYLHADQDKIHSWEDLEHLLTDYSNLYVIIEQTEILKKMVENSIKVYEQEINTEDIEELLDSVDIKIDKYENLWRKTCWEKQVNKIIQDEKYASTFSVKQLEKLIEPNKEWNWDNEIIALFKEKFNELNSKYQKEERRNEDSSSSIIKKESSTTKKRKRKDEAKEEKKSKKKQKTSENKSKK